MIHIDNLCFSYTREEPYLLKNINLHIKKGSYVSIIGENGSAKSTLIKLILNMLKPVQGSITIDTKNIGYVPQRMDSFNSQFPINIYEILHCHMKALKLKDNSLIKSTLEKVNMTPYLKSLIGNLSGGQQQKIFIGRALMGNPQVLILDEPSTGIDIQSQKDIYAMIKDLNMNHNITVLSVEHNLEAVLNNSTHVLQLAEGKGYYYTLEAFKKNFSDKDMGKVEKIC